MARSTVSGPFSVLTKETDGGIWIPAKHGSFYTGTWTDTRVAAGDYAMRKTAATNAGQAVFYLGANMLTKFGTDPNTEVAHDIRGLQITSIDLVYQITVAALNTHTFDIQANTKANNVANAVVTTPGGTLTGTLAVATQANPYVTNIALGTPYIIGVNTALTDCTLEIAWDAAATSVLTYYGIFVRCNYNLM